MDDLISRKSVLALAKDVTLEGGAKHRCIDATQIYELPSSAQKTGKWIVVSDGYGNGEATACICECSECKDTIWVYKKADRKWNYCPNCGADMRGEQE